MNAHETPNRHSDLARHRGRARHPSWVVCLLACAVLIGRAGSPTSGQEINREAKLKAVFATKFIDYTTWPAQANAAPVTLGVVGDTPAKKHLDALAARPAGRLQVLGLKPSDNLAECQVLFIPSTLPRATQQHILTLVRNRPVLTVGDSPTFLEDGGIIQFRIVDNRLVFDISKTAAQRAGLSISARLLQLAKIVK